VSITQLHSLEMEIALRLLSVNSEEGNRTDVLSNRPVPKRKPLFRRKGMSPETFALLHEVIKASYLTILQKPEE